MPQSAPPDDNAHELSAKAMRTRRRLLDAARTVFERDGFINARVVDIAKEAGVAHGSFYTYFDSKQTIFRAVVADFTGQIYHRDSDEDWTHLTVIQRIERGNRQFYDTYLTNLRMFELYEEAASYDDQVREHRIAGRHRSEERIRRSIERFQQQGLTPRALDPRITASCLVAMATHSYYTWHIREERGYDIDEANRTLTYLWAAALGLRAEPGDDEFYQSLGKPAGDAKPPRKTAKRAAKKTSSPRTSR
jgi:AcrR family transcriptional regulator